MPGRESRWARSWKSNPEERNDKHENSIIADAKEWSEEWKEMTGNEEIEQ